MALIVTRGDITKCRVDGIVSAANGIGVARAGVAGAITRAAGEEYAKNLREVAREAGWYNAGEVFVVDPGLLGKRGVKGVMQAVTMKYPGGDSNYKLVEELLNRILDTAVRLGYRSVAIPGLGTGIGNLNPTVVAHTTVRIANRYAHQIDVHVVDIDPVFVEAAEKAV
jgi:O-acetyl-ADP-ribose deacetylase (regulator of RNase III)